GRGRGTGCHDRPVRLLPTSRPLRIGLLVVVAVVAVLAIAFRQQVGDVYGYVFPDGIVDDAEDRTSAPPPTTPSDPTTTTTQAVSSTTETTATTGTVPAIVLTSVL